MCCDATGTELLVAELAAAFCSGFGHMYDGICTMRIWTGYGLVVTVATEAATSVIDGGMGLGCDNAHCSAIVTTLSHHA